MKRVVTLLFATLIFLVPSNLFLTLHTENAYVRGVLVDYLIPKFYLTDIVLLSFLLFSFYLLPAKYSFASLATGISPFKNTLGWLMTILVVIIVLFQIKAPNQLAALFYIFQLVKNILLYFFAKKLTFIYKSAVTLMAFAVTIIFQSSLALYQFITQQSLFGYHFLGEPELTYSLGLARESVWGSERLLPYGTTPHPNLLGGILAGYLIVIAAQYARVHGLQLWQQTVYYVAFILGIAALWATHSMAAWVAFFIGCILLTVRYLFAKYFTKTILIPVYVVILSIASLIAPLALAQYANTQRYMPSTSIDRRVTLQEAAIEMISKNPIVGIGLNQFTYVLEEYAPQREVIRFIQPVHSVVLLWIAETGALGLLLLVIAIYNAWRKYHSISLFALIFIPIALLDHYLLSLQSGLLLFTIFILQLQHFSQEK